jgi:hypothetical protein
MSGFDSIKYDDSDVFYRLPYPGFIQVVSPERLHKEIAKTFG